MNQRSEDVDRDDGPDRTPALTSQPSPQVTQGSAGGASGAAHGHASDAPQGTADGVAGGATSPYGGAPPGGARAAPGPGGGGAAAAGPASSPWLLVSLVLSVIACVAVFTAWQQQASLLQDLGSAREAAGAARADAASANSAIEGRLGARLDVLETRMRDLTSRVDAMQGALAGATAKRESLRATLAQTGERLDEVTQNVARNQATLADAGDVLRNARDRWVVAETEYLIKTANTALSLGGDVAVALAALRAADDHLAQLANPALDAAREALARDITALRAVPRVDVAGLAARLAALGEAVATLPLVEDQNRNYVLDPEEPDVPAGWERAQAALRGALNSLVSFRREDAPVVPLLEPDERFFLFGNLELHFAAARVACLRRDQTNYRLSLESAARALVDGGFDQDASAVQSMRAQVRELLAEDVDPPRPDISGSLQALRVAAERIR